MKKLICLLLVAAMALGLAACSASVREPGRSVYKDDIQEYITDLIDDSAEITDFEKSSSDLDGDVLTVVCDVSYFGSKGEGSGEFTLTYILDGGDWELDKCRVSLDQAGSSSNTGNDPVVETTEAVVDDGPSELSDDWKDFTFSLGGVMYQLPTHYQNFTKQGWRLDGTRSDVTEDYKVPGYTRCYVYLTNGAVYFSAEVVNMSGHARAVKDCDIGSITIQANDNLDLKLAAGIGCLSTLEEVQAAYGTPASINSYTDYSTLKYQVDDYVTMYFYIYTEKTTYNEITLRNLVAQERDATTPKDERPAYLDTYVAPTELGSDIKSSRFELDGVVYQLPCPLDAFTDNGWTVKSDTIGTLGAWNDEYGLSLTKDGYRIHLTMINLSDFETYTKHCAVSAVSIEGHNFKNAPANIAKLPGGVTLTSTVADVEDLYADFERYDGTYSTSFTYDDEDYNARVRYAYYPEDKYGIMEIKNNIWGN